MSHLSSFAFPQTGRQGTVLIVVAGLAALLLTMFLVLTRQVRAEVTDGVLVQRDAQARIMLTAALSFILEAGRLYGDQEGFGWTDVRDGSIGPKGPLTTDGAIPSSTPFLPEGAVLRVPMFAWKMPPCAVKPIVPYNPLLIPSFWLTEFENAPTAEAQRASTIGKILFPEFTNSPIATSWGQIPLQQTPKTVIPKDLMGNMPMDLANDNGLFALYNQVYQAYLYTPDLRPDYDQPNLHYALQPQPVKDTWTEFITGEKTVRPESERRAWFRIYREPPADHNGDSSPWYDRENMNRGSDPKEQDHGVFIVTCGSGGTEGFLNKEEAGSRFVVAGINRFDDLRRQERILWYRVRWSAYVGGGVDMASDYGASERQFPQINSKIQFSGAGGYALPGYQYTLRQNTNRLLQRRYSMNPNLDEQTSNLTTPVVSSDGAAPYQTNPRVLLNTLGTITMIERLEREPPKW